MKTRRLLLGLCLLLGAARAADLAQTFANPPDAARPGVYWYFMDGNLSREGMTRDLEAMRAAGLGHVLFLEVNVGVRRGPVGFLSDAWQDLFVHAVRECERLGLELMLGSGPGWTGSGGPWVKPEQSMQHLVASRIEVHGPGPCTAKLPLAPPRRPFFGVMPGQLRAAWQDFAKDVCVLAYPTPARAAQLPDSDEKALYYRAPYSSQGGVKPALAAPAEWPAAPAGSAIPVDQVLDLTNRLKPDGTLDWQVPAGDWTVLRCVSRNNGATTRPAPAPGMGFECDKLDPAALDAHFADYYGKLLAKVGPRPPGGGWTMTHIDSWEMGAQNWTPRWREEFKARRGYDPQPYYPAYLGQVVGSREATERFLWDVRQTASELVVANHAEHLKALGRQHGLTLSIEPYDMNPSCDFDLGAVADMPMAEFWSRGFDTAFSVAEASSIAHIMGRPVVGAESFTAAGEEWRFHPGYLKNQGDWALAAGVNRFTFHTFAHKPDETLPGMTMGPYGVHWDRAQTWWPLVGAYHRYLTRCGWLLRQGRTVADILYLLPEGAPNVFQPPASACDLRDGYPERRGYSFDGCSASALLKLASVRDGQVVFPSGASYRLLVLPRVETMTPELLAKLAELVQAGATVVGPPPRKSPSLQGYPECDRRVAQGAAALWPKVVGGSSAEPSAIGRASWIWYPQGRPTQSAPVGPMQFRREFTVDPAKTVVAARLEMTCDNSYTVALNGTTLGDGDNFHHVGSHDARRALRPGTNLLTVAAANGGDAPNPAGLLGALRLRYADGSEQTLVSDAAWQCSPTGGDWRPSLVLGPAPMGPWHVTAPAVGLYPEYQETADLLTARGVVPDFATDARLRYTHRSTPEAELYFVGNRTGQPVSTTASFRVTGRAPELWDPQTGQTRRLPEFTGGPQVTAVPLRLAPFESCFIVFPANPAAARPAGRNFVELGPLATLEGGWDVTFDPTRGGPAQPVHFGKLEDWTARPEPGVRYYSGLATYRTTFNAPAARPLWLDLGAVEVMARVKVNGTDLGVLWTAPWRVDVSQVAKEGANTLEIEVANLWPNRLIGDAKFPGGFTKTTHRPYRAGDALLPSGLLGPVTLQASGLPPARTVRRYPDGRPPAPLQMEALDQGIVLRAGDGPGRCDELGARDVWVFEHGGQYIAHYDGAGPRGWLACRAVSSDLVHWRKDGPVLDLGAPGTDDSASASYGTTFFDGQLWHMFYLGTPHTSPPPDRVPAFPYLTLKARGRSPLGPWTKQREVVPFRPRPGSYYSATASPGQIVKHGDEYLMFFSASTDRPIKRTLGIARTKNLDGPWTVDPEPIVPLAEQVENSSLYFEPTNATWFLFTNHVGLRGGEYTDAVWVYWTRNLNKWDAAHKAVVLDSDNCEWSKTIIGLPSVVKAGDRLALYYDGREDPRDRGHMRRHIGLAWLKLPLNPPPQG